MSHPEPHFESLVHRPTCCPSLITCWDKKPHGLTARSTGSNRPYTSLCSLLLYAWLFKGVVTGGLRGAPGNSSLAWFSRAFQIDLRCYLGEQCDPLEKFHLSRFVCTFRVNMCPFLINQRLRSHRKLFCFLVKRAECTAFTFMPLNLACMILLQFWQPCCSHENWGHIVRM